MTDQDVMAALAEVLGGIAPEADLAAVPPTAVLRQALEHLLARLVPLDAREAATVRPPAVAIHDDGHVLRHLRERRRVDTRPVQRAVCHRILVRVGLRAQRVLARSGPKCATGRTRCHP